MKHSLAQSSNQSRLIHCLFLETISDLRYCIQLVFVLVF